MLLATYSIYTVALALIKIVCLLVAIAYFTLAERKIMAAVQRRVGPNVVGLIGLLQPLADGLKLAGKEAVIPSQASGKIFMAAAMAVLLFALSGWTTMPFGFVDFSEQVSPVASFKATLATDMTRFPKTYIPNGFSPFRMPTY
jgi:NADH:ubiquinone oxidoreductase subunit H